MPSGISVNQMDTSNTDPDGVISDKTRDSAKTHKEIIETKTSDDGQLKPLSSTPAARIPLPKTSVSGYKRLSSAFRSPFRTPTKRKRSNELEDSDLVVQEIEKMKAEEAELDKEIIELEKEGYDEEELDTHITLLHQYNEMKDVGQMLLGKIAVQLGVTTKDVYEQYNLDLDD